LVDLGGRHAKRLGFSVVGTEVSAVGCREQADVIGFRSSCSLLLEAKCSRADFFVDSRKSERTVGSTDVPTLVMAAGVNLAEGRQSARLNTMDVAQLGDGSFRIIEFNCIHSSGLYAIDRHAFMETVEEAFS